MAVGDPTEPDELRRKPQLSRLPDRRNNQASRGGCHPFAKFAGTTRKLLAIAFFHPSARTRTGTSSPRTRPSSREYNKHAAILFSSACERTLGGRPARAFICER